MNLVDYVIPFESGTTADGALLPRLVLRPQPHWGKRLGCADLAVMQPDTQSMPFLEGSLLNVERLQW